MYILFPSVLPDTKMKPHKILAIIYAFLQEKSKPSLTFNPGLALTSFRTTRPRSLAKIIFIKMFLMMCLYLDTSINKLELII